MKNIITFFVLSLLIASCMHKKDSPEAEEETATSEVIKSELQSILDSANVKGAIMIYDLQNDQLFSNDFDWAEKGHLPASTFKIPNSLIALETGVVEDDSTLFKWDGEKRRLKQWEQDLVFRDAFHLSCVPCYQEIARKVGPERMNAWLKKFDYGHMQVDSSNIDVFWLQGDSKINMYEQIDFLKRFYLSELPITEKTEKLMKRLMLIEEKPEYKISGKTGWSIRNGNNNGWFVGYLEKDDKVYFFVTNVEPEEAFNMKMFPMIRRQITYKAFEKLELIDKE